MKNYWKLKSFSIFSVTYAYVDHYSYQANQLFAQNNIRIKHKEEYEKDTSPYHIIICKVIKKDAKLFEETLCKLKNKMLLLGYNDYPNICNEITRIIEEEIRMEKRNETICNN